jgi:hypothetical protein|tara:strand:- start:558 stop:899 length:342 start_codon:yes stop_codon:yes gene_type:complete
MDLFKLEEKLDAINRRLDNIEEQLSASRLPSYTGSREADHILDIAYTNNEPVGDVIKRYRKKVKSKIGKDLDRIDLVLSNDSEGAVTRGESENFLDAGDGYNNYMMESDRDGI